MSKSQQSFNKKEREKKRRKRRQEKLERREQRKLDKAKTGKKTFEEQISYVDENGNLTETPPDPAMKTQIKSDDIILGIPPKSDEPESKIKTGKVKFFNHEKGYGFIVEDLTQYNIFVHINNINFDINENDKVSFEIEKGMKGNTAVNVVKVD